jgi:catecholate siderophore receptor
MSPRLLTPPRLAASALCCAVTVAAAADGAVEKRSYNLPRGDAASTLNQFATLSGRQIVYMMDKVKGEQTNAVSGAYSPQEALDRMLAGTGLIATQDRATGAFMISRRRSSDTSGAAEEKSETHPQPKPEAKPKPEKPSTLRARLATLLALLAPPLSDAQTAPTPAESKPDEAIVLSPFTVQSDRDTGYQATNTLAGSRLNTPVKDLGAAISIYNKDFLNDIGATSTNDLLIFATGMEAAGPGGNFSNAAGQDIGATAVVGDSVRNAPQGQARARGLTSPTFTRGFFISEVGIDSYNTAAITVNRGPNAILFGVASAAGVVDTSLNQADLRRNFGRTEFRYGDNDSLRATLDLNRVIIPGKLAVRLDLLADEERHDQRPAFEDKRRVYGALTYRPFAKSAFRGNFESGNTKANRPFSVLPFDSTQTWQAGGRQTFDWRFYDDPARNPLAASQSAGGNIPGTTPAQPFRGFVLGQVQSFNTVAWQIANPTAGGGAVATGFRTQPLETNLTGAGSLAQNAIRNQVVDPDFNRDGAGDGLAFYETRNISEMPAGSFPDGRVPAGQRTQGFTDYSVFDWRYRQLDETGRQSDSFRNYNLSFEQTAWRDRLGLELSYFREEYERRNRNNYVSTQANANHIRIDANVTLPDGRPNPNVGRPFVDSAQAIYNQNVFERRAMRATGFARYDFKELSPTWGKWLGKHTATVLGEQTRRDTMTIQSKLGFFGLYDHNISVNPYDFNRLAKFFAYVGPSLAGNNNPLRLEPISSGQIEDGTVLNVNLHEVDAGSTDQARLVTVPYVARKMFRNGSYNRDLLKSKAVNLMSYWFDDHIITNLGIRRDEDYFFQATPPNTNTPEGLANLFLTERSLSDFTLPKTPPFVAGKQVKSYAVVGRWPQKLMRLPRGMDFSVFFNFSENFSPNGSSTDAFGALLPSPQGKTREQGLNFSALENRVNLRFNTYETRIAGLILGRPSAMSAMINNFVIQALPSWATEVNRNPNASRQADIQFVLDALKPADIASLYQFQYTGSAATNNLALTFVSLPNYTDTADYVAKGWEGDIVVNPTRNWRIALNFAKTESVQTNIAPRTQELRAKFEPVLQRLGNRPKFASATGYVFPTDANGNVTSLDALDGSQTVAQYFATSVDFPLANQLASTGVSAPEVRKYRVNLITNYTFGRETFLKGFGVGSGVRWQDKVGIGYPVRFRPDGTIFIDRENPYYGPEEFNLDSWVSYSRKIWKGRLDWKVQLNVRNVVGDDATIAITAQPNGTPSAVRLPPERRWYLTNSFSF